MRLVEEQVAADDADAFVDALGAIGEEHGVVVQALDARYVAGREHLEAAVRMARRAIEHDDAIADDPALEVLLYAAGRRQIARALTMGVPDGGGPLVVVVDGTVTGDNPDGEAAAAATVADRLETAETLDAARDEAAIREYFDVGDEELAATDASLEDLVVERVALLAVEK
ncbi:MAG: KEOPS complex subunit Cgi121 [Halobacteriales archaeon]